jgi:hypothetical protein
MQFHLILPTLHLTSVVLPEGNFAPHKWWLDFQAKGRLRPEAQLKVLCIILRISGDGPSAKFQPVPTFLKQMSYIVLFMHTAIHNPRIFY